VDLNCLLLTRDSALLSAVRSNASRLGIKILLDKHAPAAVEFAARHHLDGFIIDCDDLQEGREALANIKKNPANRFSTTLAIVKAGFVLGKPVEDGRLRALELALPKMACEHRRYFRHEINLPTEIRAYTGQSLRATIRNISSGGAAISTTEAIPEDVLIPDDVVPIQFDLPNAKAQQFTGKAILVWARQDVAGLRFLPSNRNAVWGFQAWLELLEAQLQFRASQRKLRPSDLTELTLNPVGRGASLKSSSSRKCTRVRPSSHISVRPLFSTIRSAKFALFSNELIRAG